MFVCVSLKKLSVSNEITLSSPPGFAEGSSPPPPHQGGGLALTSRPLPPPQSPPALVLFSGGGAETRSSSGGGGGDRRSIGSAALSTRLAGKVSARQPAVVARTGGRALPDGHGQNSNDPFAGLSWERGGAEGT